ncbi:hypothetical protein Tco_1188603 [Tanacetum coccineum]
MKTHKPLFKDENREDIDEHMYRSMIGSLMYLTSSRPDIMFAVCLWYLKDSPFDLVAYTDSDYAGASLDRKSTTRGCQFLGCRLISWQCKKQTVVANSTIEAEYVAAASCYGQVLWIQNQLLDYGYNFMHTKIYIDNESTICIVKNPVFHSKTKHIKIRHHFIRDSNEKKLIQMVKIHTDKNIADLLTKAFDLLRLTVSFTLIIDFAPSDTLKITKHNLIIHSQNSTSMAALKFADSHNMVAFLEKPTESSGFEERVDFLNAHPIRYALTVNPTIYVSCIEQFWSTAKTKTINGETQIHALVDGKKIVIIESSVRKDLQFTDEDGIDCLPNTTIFDNLKLMGKPKSKVTQIPQSSEPIKPVADEVVLKERGDSLERATLNEPNPQETGSGSGPKRQDTMGDTIAQTRFENVSKTSNDSLLVGVNTPRSDEDSMKLKELIEFCTKLQQRVLDLENTKTAQAQEITSLKLRVKKLEKK